MVSPTTEREPFAAFLYVYVDGRRTPRIRSPFVLVPEPWRNPSTTPYGDRRAMVIDPLGNIFQIAHQLS